jgi:hypothetical protein
MRFLNRCPEICYQQKLNDKVENNSIPPPHLSEVNTLFMNTINNIRFDPSDSESVIVKTLDTSLSAPEAMTELEEPFFALERGPGGHAPYVRESGISTGKEYFESRGGTDRSQFRREYDEAVAEDTEWFLSRMDTLADRGVLTDTLVIYVSDHGELLGEGGAMGHSLPIHPKHVYVPTIFIHPELDSGTRRESTVRHVDLAPTICSLLDAEPDASVPMDGRDLTQKPMASRGATFNGGAKNAGPISLSFDSSSVWDRNGGYVFPGSGRVKHLLLAGHRLLNIPWRGYARRNLREYLATYLAGETQYGTPAFDRQTAMEYLADIEGQESTDDSNAKSLDIPRERLEELGYIE